MKGSATCVWCLNMYNNKNSRPVTGCVECDKKFCYNSQGGRNCFKMHQQYGVPPKLEPAKHLKKLDPSKREYWMRVKGKDVTGQNKHTNAQKMAHIAKKRKEPPLESPGSESE